MRFLIDENVPLLVATALRESGHDCLVVAESDAQTPDVDLLARARDDERVLVTFDSDFSRLIFHELAPPPAGVVFMRSRPEQARVVARSFIDLFRAGRINPISHFVTLDMGGIVRSMPLERTDG